MLAYLECVIWAPATKYLGWRVGGRERERERELYINLLGILAADLRKPLPLTPHIAK